MQLTITHWPTQKYSIQDYRGKFQTKDSFKDCLDALSNMLLKSTHERHTIKVCGNIQTRQRELLESLVDLYNNSPTLYRQHGSSPTFKRLIQYSGAVNA